MVRISGADAYGVLSRVFSPASPERFASKKPNAVYYGSFFDKDGVFDDGLAVLFNAPHSFTGEDVAELYCHGGVLVTQKLLTAVFAAGAEPAGPGEFTKRAFINGKISLTQAEAVGGIIDAESEKALSVSAKQSKGSLAKAIAEISDELRFLAASVYAYIDYPDEDMTDVTPEAMREKLVASAEKLKKLAASHAYGKAISSGIKTAIVGKPNVGKSSLLNLLCGEDRAIVTEIAGTTRDVITENVRLGDYILRVSDTAGIRESSDAIEKLGVIRSVKALDDAELVLAVFDCSSPLDKSDCEVIEAIRSAGKAGNTVCVLNKSDLSAPVIDPPFGKYVVISAAEGKGKEAIEKIVSDSVGAGNIGENDEIVINARQYSAIEKAVCAVGDAIKSLENFTQDVAGMDIERALSALCEADGRTVGEDIVAEIFSHFCVGK